MNCNNRYAKIKDNQLEWYEQPSNILGDCSAHAKANGYKAVEVVFGEVYGFIDNGDKIVITEVEPKPEPTLLVFMTNSFLRSRSEDEIKATDIDLLQGLKKERRYSRGYLCEKKYTVEASGELAIVRQYELVYEGDTLVGERNTISWYNDNGEVAFTKTDYVNFSAKDSATRLRDIRQTQIDYLQHPETEYMSETVKQYITLLFSHYKEVVNEYILSGNQAFENAIKTETNVQIKAILDARLPDGKTVRESILYQIQGGGH